MRISPDERLLNFSAVRDLFFHMVNRSPEFSRSQDFYPKFSDLQRTGAAQQEFLEAAAAAAREQFGRKVFVRAVVEVSNFCRQNCVYCGMRRDNRELHRVRGKVDELAELLLHHRPASVTDVNLQGGEDPVAVREVVLPLVEILRRETNLGISICLGSLPTTTYDQLQNAGASIYILKFETGDPGHYAAMRSPGSFADRLQHIRVLAERGWNVSSGFIAGLPKQSPKEMMANLHLAAELPLAGCSVSPFIPGDETPVSGAETAGIDVTVNAMAALRLMRPDWVIPSVSALNLAQPGEGYRRGLRAGANLVTINLTPADLRQEYLLYKRERFIMTEERILEAISAEGLAASTVSLADHYRRRRDGAETPRAMA